MPPIRRTIETLADLSGALRWAADLAGRGLAKGPVVLSLGRPTRSLEQNARMWAMLADVARCVEWYGQKLTAEDWKIMLTASLRQQRAVPGIEGGFVVLGDSTRKMSKGEFSTLMDLIEAFGNQRGVTWTAPEEK